MVHVPVLLKEVIEALDPKPGEFFIDGTVGSGGHAAKIFEKIQPNGILLGLDLDKDNLKIAEEKILAEIKDKKSPKHPSRDGAMGQANIKNNLILVHGNYAELPDILKKLFAAGSESRIADPRADGLLLDLGFSSYHIDESGRGFSFQRDEPLDMRYNAAGEWKSQKSNIKNSLTACEIINSFPEKDLAEIFWVYGEERFSRRIAKAIVEERKKKRIVSSKELGEIVSQSVPGTTRRIPRSRTFGSLRGRHPATKVFQALRIAVNDELGNLERVLRNIDKIAKGRIAIISFHSLEDRIVKNAFREMERKNLVKTLFKKPISPGREEVLANPRSRSAKLRAAILL